MRILLLNVIAKIMCRVHRSSYSRAGWEEGASHRRPSQEEDALTLVLGREQFMSMFLEEATFDLFQRKKWK